MTTRNHPRPRWYTVILLRPDYIANIYGQDTWMGHVKARTPEDAVAAARHLCWLGDNDGIEDADPAQRADYFVIAVIRGKHNNLNPGV